MGLRFRKSEVTRADDDKHRGSLARNRRRRDSTRDPPYVEVVIPCIKRKEAFTFLHGPLYFDGSVGLTLNLVATIRKGAQTRPSAHEPIGIRGKATTTARLTVRTNRAARKVSSAGETNEFAGAGVVNEPPWERIRLRMRAACSSSL